MQRKNRNLFKSLQHFNKMSANEIKEGLENSKRSNICVGFSETGRKFTYELCTDYGPCYAMILTNADRMRIKYTYGDGNIIYCKHKYFNSFESISDILSDVDSEIVKIIEQY